MTYAFRGVLFASPHRFTPPLGQHPVLASVIAPVVFKIICSEEDRHLDDILKSKFMFIKFFISYLVDRPGCAHAQYVGECAEVKQ
jgi:hypothetical protein